MTEHSKNKAVFSIDETESYTGPEQRISQRRVCADRRDMMRFEMNKLPRRSLKERRAAKSVWDGRPTL